MRPKAARWTWESDRAQARDRGAGRERRREAHIRPDPSGCRAKHAAEPRWVGMALARHGRVSGQGQHDRTIEVTEIAKAVDEASSPPYEGDESSRT